MRRLIRDRDDTRQVFIITDALRGKSALRGLRRFAKTPAGRAILFVDVVVLVEGGNRRVVDVQVERSAKVAMRWVLMQLCSSGSGR